MISINKLSKAFGDNIALRDVDLDIKKGEFITLLGPNGAGKTTLIKIMSTLMSATSGSVTIDGYDVKEEPIEVRKRIGVISHETYLYDDLTAYENLEFYGKMYEIGELDERISNVVSLAGLQHRLYDRVGTFSRGMKQRLSIARTLLHDPPILFLDEPYTGLDQHAAATFDEISSGFAEDKTTMMATHDISRGLEKCDRLLILSSGEIVFDAPKEEIRDEAHLRSIYVQRTSG
ncbi:MAG: ABC transporter ATP-binding protein [Methanocellales archaeon]|nr:ABC transporter ATP-binding protein [Methanocellales archaeon]